jgi:hypothetical protein
LQSSRCRRGRVWLSSATPSQLPDARLFPIVKTAPEPSTVWRAGCQPERGERPASAQCGPSVGRRSAWTMRASVPNAIPISGEALPFINQALAGSSGPGTRHLRTPPKRPWCSALPCAACARASLFTSCRHLPCPAVGGNLRLHPRDGDGRALAVELWLVHAVFHRPASSSSNVPNQSYLCAPALPDILRAPRGAGWEHVSPAGTPPSSDGARGCAMEGLVQYLAALCVMLVVLLVREA